MNSAAPVNMQALATERLRWAAVLAPNVPTLRTAHAEHVLRAVKGNFTPMSLRDFHAFRITKI